MDLAKDGVGGPILSAVKDPPGIDRVRPGLVDSHGKTIGVLRLASIRENWLADWYDAGRSRVGPRGNTVDNESQER